MIASYISDLLYRHQCVIVPSFGAFVASTVSAKVEENTHTFFPPQKTIIFNTSIKNNDGLLANYIASVEKCTFEEANEKIKQQVVIWKQTLQQSANIQLPKIGIITKNTTTSTLCFEAEKETNFLTSSFGLASIPSSPIKRIVDTTEKTEPVIATVVKKEKKYAFLKYAAAIAIATTIGLSIYNINHNKKVAKEALLVHKNVQQQVDKKIQEATFFIDVPAKEVVLPVAKEKLPYHLVAGAFRSEKNANKKLLELKKQGYKATKLPQNKYQLFPVAYGSYKTLEEAKADRKNIPTEVWLMVE